MNAIAQFMEGLPDRSLVLVPPDATGAAQDAVIAVGRDDLEVQPHPWVPSGSILAKSPYALAVGESGRWFP